MTDPSAESSRLPFTFSILGSNGHPIDLANAAAQVVFQKPSGAGIIRAATIATPTTDGRIGYVTAAGDVDEWGTWVRQTVVIFDDGRVFYSPVVAFRVGFNLVPPPILLTPAPAAAGANAPLQGLSSP